ncbi:MAG: DEAD/DEAH box helicase [Erysipelotrichaceae bacterium]|nr:DEAD/DEAH box helicase [Erysipelotrichaceae bacterium]MBR3694220.1 DEAD/DEAH box helicase [Erysipelotrichales bacterium]
MTTFQDMHLNSRNTEFIKVNGYTAPTPIQAEVLPQALKGRDIVGISQTGTGKTLAFLLPIFEKIDVTKDCVQAVITAPTRELASQIYKRISPITEIEPELRCKLVSGGMEKSKMVESFAKQPHIVVGTPGRIKDMFLNEGVLRVDTAQIFVVDEADMTLEFGFLEDVDAICGRMGEDLQMMVFSATIPQALQPFLKKYLKHPQRIEIKDEHALSPKIEHVMVPCKHHSYAKTLLSILDGFNPYVCLIFANTREEAHEAAETLRESGRDVIELHGGLEPRQRKIALRQLEKNEYTYIVCSDIAARGIDVDAVSHVVSLGLPSNLEYYIHRSGRCGRAGREGTCYLLFKEKDLASVATLKKQGVSFAQREFKNGQWKEVRDGSQRKMSKKDALEKEMAKIVYRKNEKVKPGYKKKKQQEIERLKRKKRREMIQNDIKARQKVRAKAAQIEKNKEQQ